MINNTFIIEPFAKDPKQFYDSLHILSQVMIGDWNSNIDTIPFLFVHYTKTIINFNSGKVREKWFNRASNYSNKKGVKIKNAIM